MNTRIVRLIAVLLILGGVSAQARIKTRWAAQVTPETAWPEYPRAQMVRDDWMNLNGSWDYAIVPRTQGRPERFDGRILVPFCVESALSGVQRQVGPENRLWYRRTFHIPPSWAGKRVLLHFGAVDWKTTVWVNGKKLGTHKGGYDSFSFDITDALKPKGSQEIIVSVWDPVNTGFQPRGKQVLRPGGIWYTSVTGIWQTVWLEPVNKAYIKSLKIVPDIDSELVRVTAICSDEAAGCTVEAQAFDGKWTKGAAKAKPGRTVVIPVKNPKLWSPDSPFLYDLKVTLKNRWGKKLDEVDSYFGMRKISLGKDAKGTTRMMLNNKFVFQFGFLDQGWWPDGLYTAPTDEALRYDIEVTKKLGFNLARKHVKVEPDRWYYWCDKLGLLVWQDMPSGDEYVSPNDPDIIRTKESAEQFRLELRRMIEGFRNHPSIVVWVPYNEGWGQYDTPGITKMIKELDPSRLVDSASGWADRGTGDIKDIHRYPGPGMPQPEADRAIVLGEFGGLGLPIEGHSWQEKDNWGYRQFDSPEQLTRAYAELIKKLYPLVRNGLSAAVYTQTTDVEVEVNGMMTYDRAVVKMDVEDVRRINAGYFPPLIESSADVFLDSAVVRISNVTQPGQIRYTTDGTDPDENSTLYTSPLRLTQTTTVKARTYWPDGTHSDISEYRCVKTTFREPRRVSGLKPGLRYEYFEDPDSGWGRIPDLDAMTPKDSGLTPKFDINLRKAEDWFALRFEGYIKVPADGMYTFYTNSDDGSKLYIGSELVVDNDFSHPMNEEKGMIALRAGVYPIKLTFYQGMGGKGLEVSYEGPGIEKQQIPPDVLFHKE